MKCTFCDQPVTSSAFYTHGFAVTWYSSRSDVGSSVTHSDRIERGEPLSVASCETCLLDRFRKARKFPIGFFLFALVLAALGTGYIVVLKSRAPHIQWQLILRIGLFSWLLLIVFVVGLLFELRKKRPSQKDVDQLLQPSADALAKQNPRRTGFVSQSEYNRILSDGFHRVG